MCKLLNSFLLFLSCICLLASCKEDKVYVVGKRQSIVVLFTPGGLGDRGYNDMILRGLQTINSEVEDVDINLNNPETMDEAEKIFNNWLEESSTDRPSLMILASGSYEEMAERLLKDRVMDDSKKSVLLFESSNDKKLPVHHFRVPMYGVSFITGYIAAQCSNKAMVLLGNGNDKYLKEAAEGFIDGYAEQGKTAVVKSMADDMRGFSMAAEAYKNMYEWGKNYDFVYALAGGSNMGVFRYLREYKGVYGAGADSDQSDYSNRIIGSTVKRMDIILSQYIRQWLNDKTMPENCFYGLEENYSDFVLSREYQDVFTSVLDEIKNMAVDKERKYYGIE